MYIMYKECNINVLFQIITRLCVVSKWGKVIVSIWNTEAVKTYIFLFNSISFKKKERKNTHPEVFNFIVTEK